MNRQLLVGERIMYVDADTPINAVFAARIRGLISLDNLQNALNKMQEKTPGLTNKNC